MHGILFLCMVHGKCMVFCFWRQWIVLNHGYNLSDHFITSNAYTCVELNAHSLLTLVIFMQTILPSDSKNFLPWLLGSLSPSHLDFIHISITAYKRSWLGLEELEYRAFETWHRFRGKQLVEQHYNATFFFCDFCHNSFRCWIATAHLFILDFLQTTR